MPTKSISVIVADDQALYLEGLASMIRKIKGLKLVGSASNGQELIDMYSKMLPDVVIIDVEMPEMDGATALKEIRKIDAQVPILAFTAAVYDNMQADLLAKGFTDFIHKPFRPEDLHSKISTQVQAKRHIA